MPEMSLEHLLDLVKGQERVETKLDGFLATQKAHDDRITKLEGRVDTVEDSVTDIKAQRKTDAKVVAVVTSFAVTGGGLIMWILNGIGWAHLKDLIGKI
jgi:hypothetical protein